MILIMSALSDAEGLAESCWLEREIPERFAFDFFRRDICPLARNQLYFGLSSSELVLTWSRHMP